MNGSTNVILSKKEEEKKMDKESVPIPLGIACSKMHRM
jgi:hypothetical protein